ncbi:MAG TPA: glycoside hydrolase family 2 protein, partial [Anaerolineaceae bacterium]|nr:glycoside hydrolase family 2 protein [Anaerolineaceae bacterium]
ALFAEQRIYLTFDGLDTLAEVRLNDTLLGKSMDMFLPYTWEARDALREGENRLTVLFHSPLRYIASRNEERYLVSSVESIEGATYLRKAACHFGWDWGPKLPTVGIWRDLRLEGRSHAQLSDVHVRQLHEDGQVRLIVHSVVERFDSAPLQVALTVKSPAGEILQAESQIERDTADLEVAIPNPQLWWPNGYGEHPIYEVYVRLLAGADEVDRRLYDVGLRKLELRQEPDAWGRSFTFFVNDVPIFIKGANWIPVDTFATRVTDFSRQHLIHSAATAHMNMLRVWGGGLYENEHFYNLCDRNGILVWQDFMFACGVYPHADAEFAEITRQEVVEILRRFRHRACLALWCGNNEMEWGWTEWGWDTSWWADLKEAYQTFFHTTLPALVSQEDPDHPYWPSSPSSNTPFINPNSEYQGDMHYWEVWHQRKPFSAYKDTYPRFMSEFGFQSLPCMETIRTYAEPSEWNLTSYTMEHHQRSPVGNDLIISQMAAHYRMPKDFPATVYLSMVLQAEGIRTGVEHWRRNKHRVSGTLYWQLNDVWPVASWSSVDYYGRWKALQYAACRFYAPLLVSMDQNGAQVDVWLTSDLQEAWAGTLRWSLETLSGEKIDQGEEAVQVHPLESRAVHHLDYADSIDDQNRRNLVLVVQLLEGDQVVGQALRAFVPDKHLRLQAPGLKTEPVSVGGSLGVIVSAERLARFVELSIPGFDVIFSDNYFDLPAGSSKLVTFIPPENLDRETLLANLQAISLYDSYEHIQAESPAAGG